MTQPTANWNTTTINGVPYLVIDLAQFMVPLDWDPNSSMFLAVAAPNAAVQQAIGKGNFPALLQGQTGPMPNISPIINFTPLAYTDPTPDAASWTQLNSTTWQLNLSLHQGEPGTAGQMKILGAEDLTGTPVPGMLMAVNAGGTGLTFVSPLCGDRYVPAAVKAVPSGNAGYTLAPITIPAQGFDWRPGPDAQCVITPGGSDCAVDLVARLSNSNPDGGETTGNDVGRAIGLATGAPANQVMTPYPPAGSGDAWDRVPAGQAATVFMRAERQAGATYFTTTPAQTRLGCRVHPCPTTVGAVETGGGTPIVGPLTIAITAPGAFTQAVPAWANYVDVVPLGDGGGGGGGTSGAGHAGAGTSVTVGTNTLTAAGGNGGAIGNTSAAGAAGVSPGVYAYNGNTYTGGDAVAAATAGAAPGGGGGGASASGLYGYGGSAGQWQSATYPVNGSNPTSVSGNVGPGGAAQGLYASEPGASGAVWLTFRQ